MKVCVVGSGAREHALACALAPGARVVVAPGNPGIEDEVGVEVTAMPPEQVDADLFVVGPEAPLVEGLADRLRASGRAVLGPGADGARLEGSKAFMKELAGAAGVPTAAWASVDRLDDALAFLRRMPGPYVVKTDGLAAGKGVLVTGDLAEAEADAAAKLAGSSFGDAGRRVVLEEGLVGEELSLLVLCDGRGGLALPAAQDHKRLLDGDAGPNTGGMGAFSPVPAASPALVDEAMERIVLPTLAEMRRRGIDYRGVLYAGLMLTAEGPKLIEYNVRFGDPEAEVVLPRCGGDLAELFLSAATGRLGTPPTVGGDAAVAVVLAARGYPHAPERGAAIEGLDHARAVEGVTVLHAGTRRDPDGTVRVAGGRVVVVRALGETLGRARERAYTA
ncbi:MAG: phosphoribosylamine--glycine ligase, partial [Acidimicrobiales bacterium]